MYQPRVAYTNSLRATTVFPRPQGRWSWKNIVEPNQDHHRVPKAGILGPGKAILLLWWGEAQKYYLGRRLRWRGRSYLQGLQSLPVLPVLLVVIQPSRR